MDSQGVVFKDNKPYNVIEMRGYIRTLHISKVKYSLYILLFLILSLGQVHTKDTQCTWTGIDRIIALGDLHGDYNNFVLILKGPGLVDSDLHWKGGRTHLVQVGDVMDRGPDARKILDLLKKLETEAEDSGGKVHLLIGNHEESNLTGLAFDYPGYMTLEQFLSFLPENYRRRLEIKYRKSRGDRIFKNTDPFLPLTGETRKYWAKVMTNKAAQKKYFINFNNLYGKKILKHNAIIKINDIIFVHGGVSERLSTWKLQDLNNTVRKELKIIQKVQIYKEPYDGTKFEIAYNDDGLYWYRDLAEKQDEAFQEEVTRILANLKAKYMVIGHTTFRDPLNSLKDITLFNGRIYIIDTGIAAYYGSRISALIINNGKFSLWRDNNEK